MDEQAELIPADSSSVGLDDLEFRLNRRERALIKALDDMAWAADDDIPLFWFKKVFIGWMSPQSDDRKARVRTVLEAAVEAHGLSTKLTHGGEKE